MVNYKEWPYWTRSIDWSYALDHLESSGSQLQGMALLDKKHWLVICIGPSGVFWWSATRNGPTGRSVCVLSEILKELLHTKVTYRQSQVPPNLRRESEVPGYEERI